jgi:hypothetical protein
MAMSGVFQPAWAIQGCSGACCAPPANAMHHGSMHAETAPRCGAANTASCGLKDVSMAGTPQLTAAVVHHAGKMGASGSTERCVSDVFTRRPSPAVPTASTTNAHLPGPPLYLSNAVILR